MPTIFYPHEDITMGTLQEKLEILMDAADRYKAAVLDAGTTAIVKPEGSTRRMTPKDMKVAFNWQEIAKVLREIRELPENNQAHKTIKADRMARLAEIYEVLRAAKMPKLEAVRIALMNEANQLRAGDSTQLG